MSDRYTKLIERYCEAHGITIPIGFRRRAADRFAIIELTSPPRLIARTLEIKEQVVDYVQRIAEDTPLRILDFKTSEVLECDSEGDLCAIGKFDIPESATSDDGPEQGTLDDPVFGTIEFAEEEPGLGVWETEDEIEFGDHNGEPWTAMVNIIAPDSGPTKTQQKTFKELLKRYKKLWPKIAEALIEEHHRDDLTVDHITDAVDTDISIEIQEDEGDGVVIEIQYTLDLEDEGDMGYFIAIKDWKPEPAGAAD